MTLEEIGIELGVEREDGESYYVFLGRVAEAYVGRPSLNTLFLCDTYKTVISALASAVTEHRKLNVGIMSENESLKRQPRHVDESRDPSKTFHYDLDPRARAVIRNGAYVLTIQPDEQ